MELEKLPSLFNQILQSKSIATFQQLKAYVSPRLKDLTDPLVLNGMELAVTRLTEALKKQQNILIYGDFDLDGTPGVVLLLDAFESMGFKNLFYYQPKRLSEGYGLHKSILKKFIEEKGIELVVTVDVGISGHEAIDYAMSNSVDVIVTDHHLPLDIGIPNAFCVINPNTSECHSGLGYLCGTGVAFYLVLALSKHLNTLGFNLDKFNPKSLLDLFAIATLTDMVPLIKDNRVLVKHGLIALEHTQRLGLKLLLKELGLDKRSLTENDIAIRFAPKLNALSRMEEGLLPLDVMLVSDEVEAKAMIKQVLSTQEKRVKLQNQAQDFVINQFPNFNENFLFISSDQFHQGVVGLVATKVCEAFKVPCFIGCEKLSGEIVGSARVPKNSDINLVNALNHGRDVLVKFGGHAEAAGFELHKSKKSEFESRLKDYFTNKDLPQKEENVVNYDCLTSDIRDFNPDFMKWYIALSPFGMSFEKPIIALSHYRVKSFKWLKEHHLKLTLTSRNEKYMMDAIWFFADKNQLENILNQKLNLVVEPQWNYFNGSKNLQLIISGAFDYEK